MQSHKPLTRQADQDWWWQLRSPWTSREVHSTEVGLRPRQEKLSQQQQSLRQSAGTPTMQIRQKLHSCTIPELVLSTAYEVGEEAVQTAELMTLISHLVLHA